MTQLEFQTSLIPSHDYENGSIDSTGSIDEPDILSTNSSHDYRIDSTGSIDEPDQEPMTRLERRDRFRAKHEEELVFVIFDKWADWTCLVRFQGSPRLSANMLSWLWEAD